MLKIEIPAPIYVDVRISCSIQSTITVTEIAPDIHIKNNVETHKPNGTSIQITSLSCAKICFTSFNLFNYSFP